MSAKDKRLVLYRYQRIFNKPIDFEDDSEEMTDLYIDFYDDLQDSGLMDMEYLDHMGDKSFDEVIPKVGEMSYQDCLTYLTFILRSEHWSEGWFLSCIKDGSIYKLLSRLLEVM